LYFGPGHHGKFARFYGRPRRRKTKRGFDFGKLYGRNVHNFRQNRGKYSIFSMLDVV
jgi:hypothetical protein